jgi:hypothetical protein
MLDTFNNSIEPLQQSRLLLEQNVALVYNNSLALDLQLYSNLTEGTFSIASLSGLWNSSLVPSFTLVDSTVKTTGVVFSVTDNKISLMDSKF